VSNPKKNTKVSDFKNISLNPDILENDEELDKLEKETLEKLAKVVSIKPKELTQNLLEEITNTISEILEISNNRDLTIFLLAINLRKAGIPKNGLVSLANYDISRSTLVDSLLDSIYNLDLWDLDSMPIDIIEKLLADIEENDPDKAILKMFLTNLKETINDDPEIKRIINNSNYLRDYLIYLLGKKAYYYILKLNEIIDKPIYPNLIGSMIKDYPNQKAFYINDPKVGIFQIRFLWRKKDENYILEDPYIDYITDFAIIGVKALINPIVESDRVFSITLFNAKTKRFLKYRENYLSFILTDLTNQTGIRNYKKLKDALSSLLGEFLAKGLAKIEDLIPATGFFEKDNKLLFYESVKLPLALPKYDKEKTIEALAKLEKLLEFYRFSDKALAGIYFFIQSPLGYLRKLYGYENKILLLFGEPHTGKTLLCKIGSAIWGLREDQAIVGGAKLTTPQLAERLNVMTLNLTIDEVRNILGIGDIADMLKTSTTNIHIKSRIIPQLGYKRIEFHAYASITLTTNFIPYLYPGLEDRFIPVEFDYSDKRDPKVVDEFLKNMARFRQDLAFIGSYLRDLFIRRWKEIKPIILEKDQIEAGYLLLKMLYEDLGLDIPNWLKPISLEFNLETPNDIDIFFETIQEDLVELASKNRCLSENWLDIIESLAKMNALPSYMLYGSKNVYVKTSIIQHILNKKGYEIAGGLRNLALKLGLKYGNKPIGSTSVKCMFLPKELLVERLEQILEDEFIDLKEPPKYIKVIEIIDQLEDPTIENIQKEARKFNINPDFVNQVIDDGIRRGFLINENGKIKRVG